MDEKKREVRKTWVAHGYECRMVDSPASTYNGYVGVPKDHPYFGESYWDFDISVHGGVTFSQFGKDDENHFPNPDLYWIGFDTAHLGDWVGYAPERGGKKWSLEDVQQETEQMAKQLREIHEGLKPNRDLIEQDIRKKLLDLKIAIENLDGVRIPFNIIKRQIQPLKEWVLSEL